MPTLRTSWIWHGDVLEDIVHRRRARVTLGTEGAMFVTPMFEAFTVFDHTPRGTLLHLAHPMTGMIVIGGVEHDVAKMVSDGLNPTLSLSVGDQGVISLDAAGTQQLVFSVQAPMRREARSASFAGLRTLLAAAIFSIVLHAALLVTPAKSTATAAAKPTMAPADLVTHLDNDVPLLTRRVSPNGSRVCEGVRSGTAYVRSCPMVAPFDFGEPQLWYADDHEDDPLMIADGPGEGVARPLRDLGLERCAGSRARASRIVLEMTIRDGVVQRAQVRGDVDAGLARCVSDKLRSARFSAARNNTTVEWPLAPPD